MVTFRHMQFAFYVITLLLLVRESEQACFDATSVSLNYKAMTCAQAVQAAGPTFVCVTSSLKGACCNTCAQLKQKNKGNTACPYGDVGSYLFQGQPTRTQCNNPSMKQYCQYPSFFSACCNFCSGSSSSSSTTQNNDPSCTDVASVNLNNQDMTCAQAIQATGPTFVCATSNLKGACCNTCNQLKQKNQGNTACPYGDLGAYLFQGDALPTACNNPSMKQHCQHPAFFSSCCNFCSGSSSSSSTTQNNDGECKDVASLKVKNTAMTCDQVVQVHGASAVCTVPQLQGECCDTCNKLKQKDQGNMGKLTAEGYFIFDRKSLDIYMREENNDFAKAKASLLYDFNFFLHSANSLYKSMNQYGVDIELYIAHAEVLTGDIFQHSQLKSDGSIDSDLSIDTFRSYLKSSQALSNTMYDFAVLMTGYKITGPTAGYAAQDTMCKPGEAVAVVQASATMSSVRVLSHEIGHLFGANHDAPDDVYIMAPTLSTSYNSLQFTFSPRSAQDIRKYLSTDQWRAACLKSTRPTSIAPTVTPTTYTGKLQDADVICKRFNGPTSHICTSPKFYNGSVTGDNMCYMIGCRNTTDIDKCTYVIPTEGMPCAQNKACKTGKCVVDVKPNTVNVNSNCLWGDDPYIGGSLTANCAYEMRINGGQTCTDPVIGSGCCASCQKLKTSIPDCPYGDVSTIMVNYEKITCAQSVRNYGYQWTCKDVVDFGKACCKTCFDGGYGKSSTVDPVCKDVPSVNLDNKDMTCAQAVQSAGPTFVCVTSSLKGACCNTCAQLKQKNQGNTACPYGDVGSYLFYGNSIRTKCDNPTMKQYCQYPSFFSACCNFCSQ